MSRGRRRLGGLVLLLLLAAPAVQALVPVIDEASIAILIEDMANWIIEFANDATEIANQVVQIEQLILQVEAWAIALKQLDFTVLPVVGGPLDTLLQLYNQAEHAFFNAALIQEHFDELWGPFHTEQLSGEAFFAKSFDWNAAVREAHYVAMRQQAELSVSLEAGSIGLRQGLTQSEAAVGHLQAAQAGNQLLGVLGMQQQSTNAVLGTMAHAQATQEMLKAATRDQALLRLEAATADLLEFAPSEGLRTLPTRLE